jgi:hypothetical protein
MNEKEKQEKDGGLAQGLHHIRTIGKELETVISELRELTPPVMDMHHIGTVSGMPYATDIFIIYQTESDRMAAVGNGAGDRAREITMNALEKRVPDRSLLNNIEFIHVSQEKIDEHFGSFRFPHQDERFTIQD